MHYGINLMGLCRIETASNFFTTDEKMKVRFWSHSCKNFSKLWFSHTRSSSHPVLFFFS